MLLIVLGIHFRTMVNIDAHAFQLLESGIQKLGLKLTDTQIQACYTHLARLVRWNKTHNLTAISTLSDMVVLHTLDALSVFPHFDEVHSVLDVGTGAGFPGIPLAIARPDLEVGLLDSNHKKTSFVRATAAALQLHNCHIHTSRVEAFKPKEAFDAVTMRAFSDPQKAMNWVAHLLKPSGKLVLMLGQRLDESQFSHKLYKLDAISAIQVPNLTAQRHVALVIRR